MIRSSKLKSLFSNHNWETNDPISLPTILLPFELKGNLCCPVTDPSQAAFPHTPSLYAPFHLPPWVLFKPVQPDFPGRDGEQQFMRLNVVRSVTEPVQPFLLFDTMLGHHLNGLARPQ